MKRIYIPFLLVCLALQCYAQNTQPAKPGTPLNDQKKAQQLILSKDPALRYGKVAVVKGMADTAEQRFLLKDLSITQPVYVVVYTDHPNDALDISIVKPSWQDVQQKENTKEKGGFCTFRFRTFSEFGIIIKSPAGKKNFHLLTWIGDPVKYPMNTLFVSKTSYEKSHTGKPAVNAASNAGKNQDPPAKNHDLMITLIIAGIFIILFGIFFIKKRKINKTVCLLWMAGLLAVGMAVKAQLLSPATQQTVSRFADELQHSSTWQENTAERLGDLDRMAGILNSLGEEGHPVLDHLHGALSAPGQQSAAGIMTGIGRAGGQISSAAGALRDFVELWPLLNAEDHDEEPDYTPEGQPELPTMCDSSANPAACGACYAAAFGHLNSAREVLEKLKSIYKRTKKLQKKSIAFGDNVAGMTGVAALAWQQQRTLILKDYKTFLEHYKTKYTQLVTDLHAALMEISACEDSHGLPDWYNRFGFMYYDFMKERYAIDSDDEGDS